MSKVVEKEEIQSASFILLQGYALQKRRSGMTKRATIPLRGLKVGQGRTVAIPYSPGDTVSVRMFSKRNVIKTMYSFDGVPPNARKHDHAEVTMPGKRAVTVLKPFSKFRRVCQSWLFLFQKLRSF